MPAPFAPLVGFLVGVGFAWAARTAIARDAGSPFASRPVVVSAAFGAALYAPLVGYFLAFHGDWSYLYVVDWRHVPSAVDLTLVLISGASVPIGTLAALPAARARRLNSVVQLAAPPAVMACALLAWGARRLACSATYTQFHGDFGTESIASSALGRGILWMAAIGTLGIAWSVRSIVQGSEEP